MLSLLTRAYCIAAGGMGGGSGQPQEHYEKKTHSTSDHSQEESHEVRTS